MNSEQPCESEKRRDEERISSGSRTRKHVGTKWTETYLDGVSEGEKCRLSSRGIGRRHVGLDVSVKGWEDLSWSEGLGEDVEDSESEL